jgi:hypothetical protein
VEAALGESRISTEIRRVASAGAASGEVGQGGGAEGHDAEPGVGGAACRVERLEAELEEALTADRSAVIRANTLGQVASVGSTLAVGGTQRSRTRSCAGPFTSPGNSSVSARESGGRKNALAPTNTRRADGDPSVVGLTPEGRKMIRRKSLVCSTLRDRSVMAAGASSARAIDPSASGPSSDIPHRVSITIARPRGRFRGRGASAVNVASTTP